MSIAAPIVGLPGIQAERQSVHRVIFRDGQFTGYFSSGRIIDGTLSRDQGNTGNIDVLRAGLLMGRVTATKKYAPSILGSLLNASGAGATSLTLTLLGAAELLRRVGSSGTFTLTGPPGSGLTVGQEIVTYSSVNTSTGVVVCTATTNAYIAGALVRPTDGSENPLTFIPDGYGMKTTNLDGTSTDIDFPLLPIAGVVLASQVINYPTDSSLKAWLKGQFDVQGAGKWIFDDNFTG